MPRTSGVLDTRIIIAVTARARRKGSHQPYVLGAPAKSVSAASALTKTLADGPWPGTE